MTRRAYVNNNDLEHVQGSLATGQVLASQIIPRSLKSKSYGTSASHSNLRGSTNKTSREPRQFLRRSVPLNTSPPSKTHTEQDEVLFLAPVYETNQPREIVPLDEEEEQKEPRLYYGGDVGLERISMHI